MKVTMSQDGRMRFDLNITYRVSTEDLASECTPEAATEIFRQARLLVDKKFPKLV